jgi:LysR family glycine cleavage system transcriptional activator
MENLQHHRLIHLTGTLSGWSDWFRMAGLPSEQLGSGDQMDSTDFCQMAAMGGMGVMLGLDFLTKGELAKGSLVKLFDLSIASAENFYLIKPQSGPLSPAAQQFSDWLQESLIE